MEGFYAAVSAIFLAAWKYIILFLPFLSHILSPILAIYAFLANRWDRKKLLRLGIQLGEAQADAKHAKSDAQTEREKVDLAQRELDKTSQKVQALKEDIRKITEGADTLWRLRPARPFPEYDSWIHDRRGARILTVGNLKGGVGKTTFALNLAAYISETREKPVLIIDLDYQATLSSAMLQAIQNENVQGSVQKLFHERVGPVDLDKSTIHLVPQLKQAWLVPADYNFTRIENQLLLQWLVQTETLVDYPYRLAHTLLNPEIRRRYAAIIFDMPPRLTMASINALVASHYFIVPTIFDKMSGQAVGQFLVQMKGIKTDLKLGLELAGIVGNLTRNVQLSQGERQALETIRLEAQVWREGQDFVLPATMPRRTAISDMAGEEIAYFQEDSQGRPLKDLFDPIFAEVLTRIGFNDSLH